MRTLGGGPDHYHQMLKLLFDYWFCGSYDDRYESFKKLLDDNNREDLQTLFITLDLDIPSKYNDILEIIN